MWPIIWNDDANILIIGSFYECKLFERIDIRENKWVNYMINGKTFNKLFGVDIGDTRSARMFFHN